MRIQDYSIGELASETGVKVPTIRYYEGIGLIDAPPRTEGNQRRYDRSALDRLKFIAHARSMGFPMDSLRASRSRIVGAMKPGILLKPSIATRWLVSRIAALPKRSSTVSRYAGRSIGLGSRHGIVSSLT